MIELSQRLRPELRQTLELYLSPKMLQMLHILNLPYQELMEKIQAEADENPMLEVERKDELFEFIKYISSNKKIKKEADFSELPGLENISAKSESLTEHLLSQLNLEELDEEDKKIGEIIVQNIDGRGYIENYTEIRDQIIKEMGVKGKAIDKILKIIQTFEPDGVGARNLKECLLIQVKEYNFETYELEEILTRAIKNHIQDIAEGKYSKIAQALGIEEEGVLRIAEFIKENLNPSPGSFFGGEEKNVIPSFVIEKKNSGYKIINLEKNYGPLLKISPEYQKMLEKGEADPETVKFLKQKLQRAIDFMESIVKRYETSEKIMDIIVDSQAPFLERGISWLKPLPQKEISECLGVHPSTVSRSIAQKYVQTPKGLFPMKIFCPRGKKGITPARIKSMIIDIIKGEGKEHPLTDEEIKNILSAEGAEIERRTVAAYRESLGIESSKKR